MGESRGFEFEDGGERRSQGAGCGGYALSAGFRQLPVVMAGV